jgi:hypothetical protein
MYIPIFLHLPHSRRWVNSCLISLLYLLLQGLLQQLVGPPLASRAQTLSRPTPLKTSDHRSTMAYVGLPFHLFGKVRTYPDNASAFANAPVGHVLSAISTAAAARYDRGVREREFHRDAARGSRPSRQRAYSFCHSLTKTSCGCRLKWERWSSET